MNRYIYLYWIDKASHDDVCARLGLDMHLSLNGRTVVPAPIAKQLLEQLKELEQWNILRMTLHP